MISVIKICDSIYGNFAAAKVVLPWWWIPSSMKDGNHWIKVCRSKI